MKNDRRLGDENLLRTIISHATKEKYGSAPPSFIIERIGKELRYVDDCELTESIFAFYKLSRWMREYQHPFWLRGATAACFLLHLLGVSAANPLPPHYFCPKCRCTTLEKAAHDGFDLPIQTCACGRTMKRDGHNIAFEQFQDKPLRNRRNGPKACFLMDVSPEVYHDAVAFLIDHFTLEQVAFHVSDLKVATTIGRIQIIPNPMLPCKKVDWFKDYSADKLRRYALSNYRQFIPMVGSEIFKPNDFSDVIKLFGLAHGTWALEAHVNEHEETAIITRILRDYFHNALKNIPAFSDDVFDALTAAGMPDDEAWMETYAVHFGHSLSGKVAAQLGDHAIIDWLNCVVYLFPRIHAIEYCIARYKVAR